MSHLHIIRVHRPSGSSDTLRFIEVPRIGEVVILPVSPPHLIAGKGLVKQLEYEVTQVNHYPDIGPHGPSTEIYTKRYVHPDD